MISMHITERRQCLSLIAGWFETSGLAAAQTCHGIPVVAPTLTRADLVVDGEDDSCSKPAMPRISQSRCNNSGLIPTCAGSLPQGTSQGDPRVGTEAHIRKPHELYAEVTREKR
jgi:hypothetical protein